MFHETSRYAAVESATWVTAVRHSRYKRRRFLPQGETLPTLAEVAVTQGDRLDLIADRTLGDPEQYWRLCDANNAMNPWQLVAEPGRMLHVPQSHWPMS